MKKEIRAKISSDLVAKMKILSETQWRIQNKAKKKQIEVS